MEKKNEYFDESEIKPRKGLMIVLIIIALVIVVVLANKVITNHQNKQKNGGVLDLFKENFNIDINKEAFNKRFEMFTGTQDYDEVARLLDNTITSNKKNDKKINVVYNGEDTNNPEEIKNIKSSLSQSRSYEVSLDYDEDGYINKMTIEIGRSEFEANSFNSLLNHCLIELLLITTKKRI